MRPEWTGFDASVPSAGRPLDAGTEAGIQEGFRMREAYSRIVNRAGAERFVVRVKTGGVARQIDTGLEKGDASGMVGL